MEPRKRIEIDHETYDNYVSGRYELSVIDKHDERPTMRIYHVDQFELNQFLNWYHEHHEDDPMDAIVRLTKLD